VSRAEISAQQLRELTDLGVDYWWFRVRLLQVEACLRAFAPVHAVEYLDLGCGTGRTTQAIVERLRPARALAVDGTDGALAEAAARGLPVLYANLREPLELPFRPNVITALDVLEHVEDDAELLSRLAAAASADALLILTVPALPSLYSRWDELSGHHRRYRRAPLRALLAANGWSPLRVRFFFSYGALPAWIQRRVLRRVQEFEFPRVTPFMNALLTTLGRVELGLGNALPFGTSLIAVARRSRAHA
jgi:SAM-dependent methyltransferase